MSSATATDLRSVPIFQLSDEQLRERLNSAYEAIKKEKFAKGGYLTYYAPSVCPTTVHMVHEYQERKELVWLNENGEEHFVRNI